MRLLDRYLLREILWSFMASASVLMLVTLGGVMVSVVDRISRGRLPAQLLFSQLGLRSLDALTLILPLAAMIAVMLAFSRMYRDSEIAVMMGSGFAPRDLLKPVLWVGAVLAALAALLCLWLNPAGQQLSYRMIDEANRSLLVAGFDAGRFVELPGGGGVIFVTQMNDAGTEFKKMFAYNERKERVDIVTAKDGELFQDKLGSERFLSVRDGFRVEGTLDSPDFRLMQFARNDIRLPDPEPLTGKRPQERDSTLSLMRRADRQALAELQWRFSVPLSIVVVMLMALPLAKSRPREPAYGKVLIAIFSYVIYNLLLSFTRGQVALGKWPMWAGVWWVHAVAIAFVLYWLWQSNRLAGVRANRVGAR